MLDADRDKAALDDYDNACASLHLGGRFNDGYCGHDLADEILVMKHNLNAAWVECADEHAHGQRLGMVLEEIKKTCATSPTMSSTDIAMALVRAHNLARLALEDLNALCAMLDKEAHAQRS